MDKMKEEFIRQMTEGYRCSEDSLYLGGAMLNGEPVPGVGIRIPLRMLNRHGLIAGATGTGKTKTLQVIAEELSSKSVPVLLMDLKGDLSGIAVAGGADSFTKERCEKTGYAYSPKGFPVELLTISGEPGVRLRATVSEFGPILLSKILGLNETQSGILSVLFKYCDDNRLPLLDIKDLKKSLQFISGEGKADFEKSYGKISVSSTGTILRKIIELEQQGAERFFGEKAYEVEDLVRIDESGNGVISILRLTDIQEHPQLFSTFMLCLLAQIYSTFPEEGDLPAPKLMIFIDEAHLIFKEATRALLEEIDTIAKLIRSKGVGIVFCTQNPRDVPESVLAQLGMKIQHSLRAFTAKDRKGIRMTAENYPASEFYDVDALLTSLGTGEAAVTVLNEKGVPTPLAAVMIRPPLSRMGPLTAQELTGILSKSGLAAKYSQVIDRESAYEILTAKMEAALRGEQAGKQLESSGQAQGKTSAPVPRAAGETQKKTESILDTPFVKQVGRSVSTTIAREVTRGLLGVLGLGRRRR